MGFEPEFATCFEVDQDLIEEALAPAQSLTDPAPRDKIFALIERMTRVARPRQGAARLLAVFARLAECAWLEGELEILICDLGEATGIDVMLHDGLSFARLHAPMRVGAPFEEFTTAFEQDPLAVSPLEQAPADLDVLRLRATEATRSRGARHAADFPLPTTDLPDLEVDPPVSSTPSPHFETKPTVRLRAVKIPREAYRDDRPPVSGARAVGPSGEPVTVRMEAVRQQEAQGEPAPSAEDSPTTKRAVDEIDEGWE